MSSIEEYVHEEYEPPTIKKHTMLFTLSPAGCKLGHGLFPFQRRRQKSTELFVSTSAKVDPVDEHIEDHLLDHI